MKPLLLLPVCFLLTQCAETGPPGYGAPFPGIWGSWAGPPPPPPVQPGPPSRDPGTVARYRKTSQAPRRPVPYPMDGVPTESTTGNRTWRDRSSGIITGSEWTSPAGTTTYRDASGRIQGSSDESPAGTRTYRDDNGSITQTSSTSQGTGGDHTTTFRRDGSVVGTKYVSPAGNVTWRDGNGSIIDGPGGMKP